MTAVYSQVLGRSASFNNSTPTALFVADGLHRTVIKCMTIGVGVNIIPGEARILGPSLELIAVNAAQASDLPTKASVALFFGMWVIEPGDPVYIQTFGGWTADFYASGYLLQLP